MIHGSDGAEALSLQLVVPVSSVLAGDEDLTEHDDHFLCKMQKSITFDNHGLHWKQSDPFLQLLLLLDRIACNDIDRTFLVLEAL